MLFPLDSFLQRGISLKASFSDSDLIFFSLSISFAKKVSPMEAGRKCSDARHLKSLGARRTEKYAAVTRDEDNAADGRFLPAS